MQKWLGKFEKSCHGKRLHLRMASSHLHQKANLSRRPATARGRRRYSPILAMLWSVSERGIMSRLIASKRVKSWEDGELYQEPSRFKASK